MGNYSYYCLLLAAAVCAVCTPCHCWCCLLLLFRLFFFIVFFPIYTIYIYVIRIVYVLISPRFFDVRQRLDDPALEPMCRRGHISCRRLTYKCLALGQHGARHLTMGPTRRCDSKIYTVRRSVFFDCPFVHHIYMWMAARIRKANAHAAEFNSNVRQMQNLLLLHYYYWDIKNM